MSGENEDLKLKIMKLESRLNGFKSTEEAFAQTMEKLQLVKLKNDELRQRNCTNKKLENKAKVSPSILIKREVEDKNNDYDSNHKLDCIAANNVIDDKSSDSFERFASDIDLSKLSNSVNILDDNFKFSPSKPIITKTTFDEDDVGICLETVYNKRRSNNCVDQVKGHELNERVVELETLSVSSDAFGGMPVTSALQLNIENGRQITNKDPIDIETFKVPNVTNKNSTGNEILESLKHSISMPTNKTIEIIPDVTNEVGQNANIKLNNSEIVNHSTSIVFCDSLKEADIEDHISDTKNKQHDKEYGLDNKMYSDISNSENDANSLKSQLTYMKMLLKKVVAHSNDKLNSAEKALASMKEKLLQEKNRTRHVEEYIKYLKFEKQQFIHIKNDSSNFTQFPSNVVRQDSNVIDDLLSEIKVLNEQMTVLLESAKLEREDNIRMKESSRDTERKFLDISRNFKALESRLKTSEENLQDAVTINSQLYKKLEFISKGKAPATGAMESCAETAPRHDLPSTHFHNKALVEYFSSWLCNSCTYSNNPGRSVCEMCGSIKHQYDKFERRYSSPRINYNIEEINSSDETISLFGSHKPVYKSKSLDLKYITSGNHNIRLIPRTSERK